MPYRAPRLCKKAGCSTPTTTGYCAEHLLPPKVEPGRNRHSTPAAKRYDKRRGSAHSRGYGVRWRRLRKVILDEEPLCRPCKQAGRMTPAIDVDHILPRDQGGSDEDENLQPICRECHAAKTVEDNAEHPEA